MPCPHDSPLRRRQVEDTRRALLRGRTPPPSGSRNRCKCCAAIVPLTYRYCGYCSADGYKLNPTVATHG